MQTNQTPRDKLKQKMNAERLKRSSSDAQRLFLEKNKVPKDLVDTCMNQINHKAKPSLQTVQNLLTNIQNLVSKSKEEQKLE